jgi:D-threo-aldose 1-dehydrogenase
VRRRRLGRTAVELDELGFGGATISRVGETQAAAALDAAWQAGIRYYDTAPWYGRGLSELRVGRLLREQPRSDFVVSTKVGRILRAARAGSGPFEVVFDYSANGIQRAFEDSLQRLGLSRVDMLIVHDLDFGYHAPQARWDAMMGQLLTSGWRQLDDLRSAGAIGAVGVGINPRGMIPRFLELFDPDFFVLAGRYTLMEQDVLDDELPACVERGVGIVIGAPFNSGLLAVGPTGTYDYAPASPERVEKVTRIATICARYDVPLPAAALQFVLAHPAVASVIPGPATAEEARANVEATARPIPAGLWSELREVGLLRSDAPVPSAELVSGHA